MTEKKALSGGMLVLILGIMMCLAFSGRAYAWHSPVGKPASSTYVKNTDKRQVIIYVGDSRVMYMTCGPKKSARRANFAFAYINGGNVTSIGKNGSLTPYVTKLINKYRARNPVIVFNFGLNGNGNAKKNAKRVIRIYRQWMKQYPDLRFVVESVNPTRLTKGSYSDKKVVRLNKRLRAAFEPEGIWMDNYTVMLNQKIVKKSGYGFKDNYHYKWKTSKKMLRIVRKWVEENVK